LQASLGPKKKYTLAGAVGIPYPGATWKGVMFHKNARLPVKFLPPGHLLCMHQRTIHWQTWYQLNSLSWRFLYFLYCISGKIVCFDNLVPYLSFFTWSAARKREREIKMMCPDVSTVVQRDYVFCVYL
jgi:hypothetical protein